MDKQLRFSRLEKVIGEDNVSLINNKSVLILGVGGVGGYVAEALARSNIGKLILVDFDVVDESNINRQIIALESTIGMKKVDVLEKRIKEINSSCEVIKIDKFIDLDNYLELFEYNIDYFVDACDTMTVKKAVIKECIKRKINFISSMGTGNKLDPTKLSITDIRKTNNDPVARIIRKWVKDNKINKKIPVLCSSEVPKKVGNIVSSNSFVPSTAGLIITGYIIDDIIKES